MKEGDRVVALCEVTEDGMMVGDPKAVFPSGRYIHALPGDTGTVVHIEDFEDAYPTVRFDRTGTATLCRDRDYTDKETGTVYAAEVGL